MDHTKKVPNTLYVKNLGTAVPDKLKVKFHAILQFFKWKSVAVIMTTDFFSLNINVKTRIWIKTINLKFSEFYIYLEQCP